MTKKSEEPNLIDRFLEAEWPELRTLGRERFVWQHRVVPVGLPLAAIMVVCGYWQLGYSFRHLLTLQGAALGYLAVVISVGVTYFFGRLEWDEREEKYRQRNKINEDDRPEGEP